LISDVYSYIEALVYLFLKIKYHFKDLQSEWNIEISIFEYQSSFLMFTFTSKYWNTCCSINKFISDVYNWIEVLVYLFLKIKIVSDVCIKSEGLEYLFLNIKLISGVYIQIEILEYLLLNIKFNLWCLHLYWSIRMSVFENKRSFLRFTIRVKYWDICLWFSKTISQNFIRREVLIFLDIIFSFLRFISGTISDNFYEYKIFISDFTLRLKYWDICFLI
jgi:hypothetical protein